MCTTTFGRWPCNAVSKGRGTRSPVLVIMQFIHRCTKCLTSVAKLSQSNSDLTTFSGVSFFPFSVISAVSTYQYSQFHDTLLFRSLGFTLLLPYSICIPHRVTRRVMPVLRVCSFLCGDVFYFHGAWNFEWNNAMTFPHSALYTLSHIDHLGNELAKTFCPELVRDITEDRDDVVVLKVSQFFSTL